MSENQVYEIRAEWDRGIRGKDIFANEYTYADVYGIGPEHYSMIGRRKRWSQLPERE